MLGSLAAVAIAFASSAQQEQAPAMPLRGCSQISSTVISIQGSINQAMAACIATRLTPDFTELIVNSGGGDISTALDIASRLARPKLTVRVREKCYSSCANYLIPLATDLIVEQGATIVLHGGADPLLLHKDLVGQREALIRGRIQADPKRDRIKAIAEHEAVEARVRLLIERQKRFAMRHNVGLGWFLYREPGDSLRSPGRYLSGERGPKPGLFGFAYLLAEEPLVASCLPRVRFQPFQRRLEADFIDNKKRFGSFGAAGGMRSLRLQCVEPARP